jgi:acyl dehydratase
MKVGDYFEEKLKFNYDEMISFLDSVKDDNPAHRLTEEEKKNPDKYNKLTVQGMYAVGMFSGILNRNFPNSINVYRDATFVRPILLGDTYTMSLQIREILQDECIGVIKGYIKNSKGKVCIDCNTKMRNEKFFGKN